MSMSHCIDRINKTTRNSKAIDLQAKEMCPLNVIALLDIVFYSSMGKSLISTIQFKWNEPKEENSVFKLSLLCRSINLGRIV